jgi:hypothetical protein
MKFLEAVYACWSRDKEYGEYKQYCAQYGIVHVEPEAYAVLCRGLEVDKLTRKS